MNKRVIIAGVALLALALVTESADAGRGGGTMRGPVVRKMPRPAASTVRPLNTRRAPQEIRKFSLLFGDWSLDRDVELAEHVRVLDCGDVDVVPGDTPESYARLERRVAG